MHTISVSGFSVTLCALFFILMAVYNQLDNKEPCTALECTLYSTSTIMKVLTL